MGREDQASEPRFLSDSARFGPPRRVSSTALFSGDRELVIVHGEKEYRLRITKTDKLILTK